MKCFLTFLFLVGIAVSGWSQDKLDYTAAPKHQAKGISAKGLTASSARLLAELSSGKSANDSKLCERYGISEGMVTAVVVLNHNTTPEQLETLGVKTGSIAGETRTVTIPVSRYAEFATSGLCSLIDIGPKIVPMLEKVRENMGIDDIRSGLYIPQGYDGSGVVVGVIDQGFEFCHPTFYDTTGTILRVKRVWNQRDTAGTPPAQFNYGSEYTTEAEMKAKGTESEDMFHATHVAGIAAGSGAPSGNGEAYRGIAPGADLVFVPSLFTVASILDAITYIHNYAKSVGKPCVINMSFGSTAGPHDGTSTSDLFLRTLIEENSDSLVLVASAGNDGNNKIHISKQFSTTDTMLRSGLEYRVFTDIDVDVDIFCPKNFRAAISLVNNSGTQIDFTGFFNTGVDTLISTQLSDNSGNTIDCDVYITSLNAMSGNYNIYFNLHNEGSVPSGRPVLTICCDSVTTLHAWTSGLTFNHWSYVSNTMDGDSQYSIGGFGANTDVVVSVGAYSTCKLYNDIDGVSHFSSGRINGDLAYFSSLGPTLDGRVKPDIAAPGDNIISSYSRFSEAPMGYYTCDSTTFDGNVEYFGSMSGTSMSSPAMTGVVALWMQHNPALGTDSVRAILHRTAHHDQFTSQNIPNNSWGYGKVNAYGGLPPTDSTLWLVTVISNDESYGYVNGGGVLTEGLHTITAFPRENYIFLEWSDGNTDNPRIVNIVSDTVFTATFNTLDYEDCDTVCLFPWNATIDNNMTCWKTIDADGDDNTWFTTETVLAASTSAYFSNIDNWLITKAIRLDQPLTVRGGFRTICTGSSTQDISFLISTTGSEIEDFTTLASQTMSGISNAVLSASLNDYTGQTVRIAIRNHNCTSGAISMVLDSLSIVSSLSAIPSAEPLNYSIVTRGLQLTISGIEGHAIEIFDITGRLIAKRSDANGTFTMPSTGVYIVHIDGAMPKKVVLLK